MVKKGTKKGNHRHGFQLLLGGDSLVRVGPANFSLTNYESKLVSFPPNQQKQNKQVLLDFLTKNSSRLILTYSSTNTISEVATRADILNVFSWRDPEPKLTRSRKVPRDQSCRIISEVTLRRYFHISAIESRSDQKEF